MVRHRWARTLCLGVLILRRGAEPHPSACSPSRGAQRQANMSTRRCQIYVCKRSPRSRCRLYQVACQFLLTGGCAACQGDQLEIRISYPSRGSLLRVPAGCASGTLFSFFPSGAQHRPRGQETIQTRKGRANARTIRRCNVDSVRPNTSNAASSPRSRKDLLRAKRRARGGRFLRPCVIMQIFSIPPY